MRLAIVLETATTLGAASGVLLSGVVPVPILYAIFAAVLLVSAWQMLMRQRDAAIPEDGSPRRALLDLGLIPKPLHFIEIDAVGGSAAFG